MTEELIPESHQIQLPELILPTSQKLFFQLTGLPTAVDKPQFCFIESFEITSWIKNVNISFSSKEESRQQETRS